jgi:hypothetical protein
MQRGKKESVLLRMIKKKEEKVEFESSRSGAREKFQQCIPQ